MGKRQGATLQKKAPTDQSSWGQWGQARSGQGRGKKKAKPVIPPMFLKKPSWSSEDFWVLSISYNQNLATLSFVAAPSISQVLTGPSVDELPAIQAVQEGLVVLYVLFTA